MAEAIHRQDARRIGQLVDTLRFQYRATYDACYSLAHELTGIDVDEWDALLYAADLLESSG